MESLVYEHFGSAPMFIVVDTDTGDLFVINNKDQHHAHGTCNPVKAIDGHSVDAIIVGGIGVGALRRLNQAGIRVYHAQAPTVKDNLEMFKSMSLSEFTHQHSCRHSHGRGCNH